jgi:signal transduction histidine kinase
MIAVQDTGEGIPPEAQEKIFDRFYQVDQSSTRKAGGTGLGLYICRRLAEAIGGRVWLERSDKSGSEFALWIPCKPPSGNLASWIEPQPAEQASSPSKLGHVL